MRRPTAQLCGIGGVKAAVRGVFTIIFHFGAFKVQTLAYSIEAPWHHCILGENVLQETEANIKYLRRKRRSLLTS